MNATIEFNVNFWTLGFLSLNFILVLLTFLNNRHKAATDDLKAVKTGLDTDIETLRIESRTNDRRIAGLESDMRHMPTHEHLGDVHEKINDVAKQTERLTAGTDKMLTLLEKRISEIDGFLRER